jgi:hypothetical protein
MCTYHKVENNGVKTIPLHHAERKFKRSVTTLLFYQILSKSLTWASVTFFLEPLLHLCASLWLARHICASASQRVPERCKRGVVQHDVFCTSALTFATVFVDLYNGFGCPFL